MKKTAPVFRIANLNKRRLLNIPRLRKLVLAASESMPALRRYREIECVFLDDRRMRPLNLRYKGKGSATDVLAFRLAVGRERGGYLCGILYISSDTAARNSRLFGAAPAEEIARTVTHGLLHLAGYDDEAVRARKKMWGRQEGIVRGLCKRGLFSRVLTRP